VIHNLPKRLVKIFITAILSLGFIFAFSQNSYAKSNNDFSKSFGLIVHNGNRDRLVTRAKVLEVLLKYFSNIQTDTKKKPIIGLDDVIPSSDAFNYVEKGCRLNLFDCSVEKFNPYLNITQQDLLNWFFKLKYFKNPDLLNKKYPYLSDDYLRNWLEARNLNLLTSSQITYSALQDFLYRNKVVESNLNLPFRVGLTIGYDEINAENFHNLKEIDLIRKNLNDLVNNLHKKDKLSIEEENYLAKIQKNLLAFENLKESLIKYPYLLSQNTNLDTEVINAVRQYGLQDILSSYSYDYSHNAAYRKHNLVTGAMKMNGRVFMPGEVIDYLKIISDKQLREFIYGWVISQGEEQWQFGGGICGSSSVIFLPSWKAGLEIIERRNHSKYYRNLYPIEYIGLDATVYRPKPNLRIRNNMNSPIIFSVKDNKEKQIVTVDIIGNKSYKDIRIEGPIYINKYHVKWVRQIEDFDGKITSDALESRYNAIY